MFDDNLATLQPAVKKLLYSFQLRIYKTKSNRKQHWNRYLEKFPSYHIDSREVF